MSVYTSNIITKDVESNKALWDLLAKINAEADKVMALQKMVNQALNTDSNPTFGTIEADIVKLGPPVPDVVSSGINYPPDVAGAVQVQIPEAGSFSAMEVYLNSSNRGRLKFTQQGRPDSGILPENMIVLETDDTTAELSTARPLLINGQDLSTRLNQNVKTTDSPIFARVITPKVDNGGSALQLNPTTGNVLIGTTTDLGGTAKLQNAGFTSLGADANHPGVKVKVIDGFNTSGSQGGSQFIAHGLTGSKIVSVSCIVAFSPGAGNLPDDQWPSAPGFRWNYYYDTTYVVVRNFPAPESANVLNKQITITILYKE